MPGPEAVPWVMAEIALRDATSDDREGMLAALEGEPFWARYALTGAAAKALVDAAVASGQVIVAESTGLLGWLWLVPGAGFGRGGYVRFLAVRRDSQGLGVGRSLMEEAERRSLASAGVFVMASSENAKALAFYARLGYQPVGRVPDFVVDGLDEIIFWKARAADGHPAERTGRQQG